ncbi:MAG: hypothetical protein HFI67_00745 [Lachnospiraceae bacterium]|nr:hypothetical protein [Lachnospiraceae bacterium]
MKKKRKKTVAAFLLAAFLTGVAGAGFPALAVSEIGDTLVGPGKTVPENGQAETGGQKEMENGQTEEQHKESESPFPVNDNFQEMVGTADLIALWDFIQNRETVFWEKQSQKMAEAGILAEDQNFLHEEGFQDTSKQILAMTAVCREYTFYNRIVCQWYADHLWEQTYTYDVVGTKYQEKAIDQLLPFSGAAADFLGLSSTSLADAVEHAGDALRGKCRVAVILRNRSREEIYDTDYYSFRIPVEWEGWTQEKREECDRLMELDEASFWTELEKRQAGSLLYTPVPFYKQGAAEWGAESFGSGTLASDACCPTAIAMVVSYFKGERITPSEVSKRYDQDAYRSREQGSYGGKMCSAAAADYGLLVQADTAPLSKEQILGALEDGAKIVMSMKPGGDGGRYATVYHYVVLAGLTEEGKIIVNNPGINTNVTYDDIETVLNNQSGRGYGIFRAR